MALKNKVANKNQCPKCGSLEFITDLNQYDVLRFRNGHFEIERSELCDDFKLFCRDCDTQINEKASEIKDKVVVEQAKNR